MLNDIEAAFGFGEFTLLTHRINECPHHQRICIAAAEKKIPLHIIDEAHVYEKRLDCALSHDLVPCLTHDDKVIMDSNNVVMYLDDIYPDRGTRLCPSDPYGKSQIRYYITFAINRLCNPFYKFLSSKREKILDEVWLSLIDDLQIFCEAMHKTGPFFNGSTLSAVDICYIPYALRYNKILPRLHSCYDFKKLNPYNKTWLTRYWDWLDAIYDNESVKLSLPEQYDQWVHSFDKYVDYDDNEHKDMFANE